MACFIPQASDAQAALRVIGRFRELQGSSLVGGIVLKAYHRLLGRECRACADGALERRSFVVAGCPVETFCRDARGSGLAGPPEALLRTVAGAVPPPFFTMDWGARAVGGFLLLEVGDGGVSGIPDHPDPGRLLACLKRRC